MSLFEYQRSAEIVRRDEPFFALVMAAMRQADTDNATRLREAFPETWRELQARYHAPGGRIDGE